MAHRLRWPRAVGGFDSPRRHSRMVDGPPFRKGKQMQELFTVKLEFSKETPGKWVFQGKVNGDVPINIYVPKKAMPIAASEIELTIKV